ncbi:MAG TPA: fasciclin domain-containing protein [Streptosporangiaceae bacterium]|nr:fasciclin domain-containing protein [Streptosporangiaceae bacterium]
MKIRLLAISGLAAGLALTAAACSSSPSSSSASSPATSAPASSGATTSDFGPGCASVPKSGAGSFTGMSTAPVATAASANPVLSTLVTAVKKAGLVDTLNSASGITVFAPDNAAFAKIPAATLSKVLSDKAELTKILTYHVVAGRHTPTQLAAGTPLKTLEGGTVTPALMGSTYEVNSADVVCGNVQTANATVYIINTVLMPPSS